METHDAAGVDLTQIDILLRMSPRDRLAVLCEMLQGAPAVTFDPGVLCLREPANVSRLMRALGELEVGRWRVKVLSLERLIDVKAKAGREKDLAVLPLLRATLARSRKRP